MADAVDLLARSVGIVGSYTDQLDRRRHTSRATKAALLKAMGFDPANAADHLALLTEGDAARCLDDYYVCDEGSSLALAPQQTWALSLDNGQEIEGRGDLPPLPLGIHRLTAASQEAAILCAPRSLPQPGRAWGVMVPLHALRSPAEGGLADYSDLAVAGGGFAAQGASFLGLNPIHAGFWNDPSHYSPYAPSHRRRLNTFFVSAPGESNPSGDLIDFGVEIPRRREALASAYCGFQGSDEFERYKTDGGRALRRFAVHQALSDMHGPYWRDWPARFQTLDDLAASDAALLPADAIDFHCWLQWRAEQELASVQQSICAQGMATGLYLDLAVGTHPYGAETWEDRDSFAFGASLGAPPDAFSSEGQSWGLAPFNPSALIGKGFAPLAETLRRQLQFAGALRIDHILGFDRAFWVPESGEPGTYVRMPRDAMLAVLRLEAARADALIVGEDLGNIPRGLRPALKRSGVLSCQVQIFEHRKDKKRFKDPHDFDEASMASFSTHDLPTWVGWRRGLDIETHRALGHIDTQTASTEQTKRARDVAAFDSVSVLHRSEDCLPDSVDAMHATLGTTHSALVMLQIENLLEIERQPNLPGTTSEYPNWRQRLPLPARDFESHPAIYRAAKLMADHGR